MQPENLFEAACEFPSKKRKQAYLKKANIPEADLFLEDNYFNSKTYGDAAEGVTGKVSVERC